MERTDMLKQPIRVGDIVIITNDRASSGERLCVVHSFTPKMVRVYRRSAANRDVSKIITFNEFDGNICVVNDQVRINNLK